MYMWHLKTSATEHRATPRTSRCEFKFAFSYLRNNNRVGQRLNGTFKSDSRIYKGEQVGKKKRSEHFAEAWVLLSCLCLTFFWYGCGCISEYSRRRKLSI